MQKLQNVRKNRIPLLIFLVLCVALAGCARQEQTPVQKNGIAMGSVVSVKLYNTDAQTADTLCAQVFAELQRLDTQVLSKNTETSELWRLNQSVHPEIPQEISSELYTALLDTKNIYAYSYCRAAVASGALTEIWGMDTEEFRVPSEAEIDAAKRLCTDDTVQLDEENRVAFREGQKLNLGSVGKGIGCDRAVAVLLQNGFSREQSGAVISVGGSLGVLGSPKAGGDFTVGVRDPFGAENEYFATLKTGECFISTSGSYEKTFTENGKTYHHLLDLASGYPAETQLVSVTVRAKNGLLSDALSTLCFLVGEEKARPIVSQYSADALFVYADKTVHMTDRLRDAVTITDSTYHLEEL